MIRRMSLGLGNIQVCWEKTQVSPDCIIKKVDKVFRGFPGDSVVKNPPANVGGTGSTPDLGRSHRPWTN